MNEQEVKNKEFNLKRGTKVVFRIDSNSPLKVGFVVWPGLIKDCIEYGPDAIGPEFDPNEIEWWEFDNGGWPTETFQTMSFAVNGIINTKLL